MGFFSFPCQVLSISLDQGVLVQLFVHKPVMVPFFWETLKVHETRSHAHAPGDEEKVMTRKQKAESKANEVEHSPKKAKVENGDGHTNGKSAAGVAAEYDEFCKATSEHLPIEQMREILEANGLDSLGSDLEITRRWLV